ncbi:replicative DNA helicase [Opitutaceae bacterium TAV1]|nr:replicative DNA helicase [Opitutaceae bacterium TAV1]
MPDDSSASARSLRRPRRDDRERGDRFGSDGASGAPGALVGRVPPHSVEAEEYLLSCCLLDGGDVISRCLEGKVLAKSFYVPANQVIFSKLIELYNKGSAIDLAVLAEELKTSRQLDEIGGYAYLTRISGSIPTTAQAGYFIEKVRELHLLREIIRAATHAVENCYEYTGGLQEFVDKVEQDIFRVTQERVGDGARSMREPTREAMTVVNKMFMKRGELTGVSTGFKDLDRFMFGLQKQEMIVLAGRPSCGKTSLAMNIAEHAALPLKGAGVATLVFSLEMSAAQLALRLLCSRSRVNMHLLRDGLLSKNGDDHQRLLQVADEFTNSPLFVDDSSALTIMELRAKARRLAARQPLGLIIVDYLQLISPTDPKVPREQQVAEASRGLKALAKELDVPVIVLAQLNRSAEKESRTPRLSDLRESGSIEQDADVVLMLSRPRDADDKFQVAGDKMELYVAKNRNGEVGETTLTFLKNITRFENYTP